MVSPASRLGKIPPYLFGEIARAKAKAKAEGRDLIDLGIGDPDQPTPAPILDALTRAARDPATHRYDESDAGWPPFLASVARWYGRRFGVELDPESEALLLIGSKEGLAHLAWAYVDPGDLSLVPDPAYTVYKMNTLLAGGDVQVMPLRAENGFLPVLEEVPPVIAHQAKLLYLNYPNNPTGATATLEFFRQVVDFAREHDLIVCHDCAYSEVYFDGYRPPSFLQVPGAKEVGIEIHSVSKTFNMTGWRVGFAIGGAPLIAALGQVKSNTDSGIFTAIQFAAQTALERYDTLTPPIRALYKERRDAFVAGLKRIGWEVPAPQATFYVWIPCPKGITSTNLCGRLLDEADVVTTPGIGFGRSADGYIRAALTVETPRLLEAVERIGKLKL
jgi:LL-diaminopimelate aminotransferase